MLPLFYLCALGRRLAMYYKGWWWVKCNCGCMQTHSNKRLFFVDFPLLHVMVELLLLLLWSRRVRSCALQLLHRRWKRHWCLLKPMAIAPSSIALSGSLQSKSIPIRPKWNSLSSIWSKMSSLSHSHHHYLCISWQDNSRFQSTCNGLKTF